MNHAEPNIHISTPLPSLLAQLWAPFLASPRPTSSPPLGLSAPDPPAPSWSPRPFPSPLLLKHLPLRARHSFRMSYTTGGRDPPKIRQQFTEEFQVTLGIPSLG